ncbi:methyltransferase domain-containing protein [Micromonospora fluostatini]|uniref:Protein-L-isoaspartate O-methyltransferase n=1 Tax=Micromonospora fluostatini TaxID=1629071 RepID=A0ABY2DK08_9ACTN|nr:methyltransferase domain-containing protein [Micromonospora fluostatini]
MTVTTEHRRLRLDLVGHLSRSAMLSDPSVAAALAVVDRHHYAPAVYRVDQRGRMGEMLVATDPAHRRSYLEAVYSDEAIVTQVSPTGIPTSSSTQPGVMAVMLEALRLRPGMDVLEIGTGTGYNAALLCAIVGDEHVTSVDIDPTLVDDAITALAETGFAPTVVAADGLGGWPVRSPYDRVIATCSVRRVPTAWLAQTRPGGIVLANLSYGVVALAVEADGSGEGRFLPQVAAFIEARPADGPTGPTSGEMVARCTDDPMPGAPARPEDVELLTARDSEFFWQLGEPSVSSCTMLPDDGEIHCLVDSATGSWARVENLTSGVTVAQGGPRRIWDAVVTWCRRWEAAGRPAHDRLGLTVTADGAHEVWVDEPGSAHRWRLS